MDFLRFGVLSLLLVFCFLVVLFLHLCETLSFLGVNRVKMFLRCLLSYKDGLLLFRCFEVLCVCVCFPEFFTQDF